MRDEAKVSPEEVGQYYAEHQPEYDTIQVREFLVRKQPARGEDPESVKPEDAKGKAESIRKALAAGTSLEDVAEEFATRGVLLIDPKPRTFRRSEMIPALAKATFDLKDGDVSDRGYTRRLHCCQSFQTQASRAEGSCGGDREKTSAAETGCGTG